ncbi:hypothetical protein ASZ78_004824 [Callipepla squamata]|uniref:GCM domain-containing protein n=1 Tax=Callipepla squamata TaxID=9009 RepID=A0A226N711_CALSU|nr:hypothetical protein ASZ78_004824 [Callipepla squamata]
MKLTWDINDPKLPQEWPDGYVRLIYSSEERNAQRHLSGWAMRNTNNHNCQILKKSCLGVVCLPVLAEKVCPNCNAALQLIPCRGHSGYPVTNFWRLDGKAIFFQVKSTHTHTLSNYAKGVHDHPRPESKLEAEARRSAIKKQMLASQNSQKKRFLNSEAGRYHDSSGYVSNMQNLPSVDVPERVSIITDTSFSIPAQSYPLPQNTDLYKMSYDSASFQEDQLLPYQKCPNPRIYVPRPCSYEFGVPPFISSNPYPSCYKDPPNPPLDADPISLNGSHYNSLTTSDKSFDHTGRHYGLKPTWGKTVSGDRSDYSQMQASTNHPYYGGEYSSKYGPSPSPTAPPLQTVITTTTKVSYQAYKPSMLKYSDNLCDMKNVQSYTHVAENVSGTIYSGMKIQEDFGMIKSALLYQHDPITTKSKPVESMEAYRYGFPLGNSYAEHEGQALRFESAEY